MEGIKKNKINLRFTKTLFIAANNCINIEFWILKNIKKLDE